MKVHNRWGEGLVEVNNEQVVLNLQVMLSHESEKKACTSLIAASLPKIQ